MDLIEGFTLHTDRYHDLPQRMYPVGFAVPSNLWCSVPSNLRYSGSIKDLKQLLTDEDDYNSLLLFNALRKP